MITLSPSEVSIFYALRVPDLRQRGRWWRGRCPAHQGTHPNFTVDPETGFWRCWSRCGRGGDIITLEVALTSATWPEAVAAVGRIIGRSLINRPAAHAERRAFAERRDREQREIRAAEFFRIAAASMAEQILDELPEAVPERYAPTQLRLALRAASGGALLTIYRDFRAREPRLTAALVHAGTQVWRRLCRRLARFVAAGMEVPDVA
jgi:hypothetical protein